jgi:hypothetical protein
MGSVAVLRCRFFLHQTFNATKLQGIPAQAGKKAQHEVM